MKTHLVFGYGTLQHTPDMKRFDSQLESLGAEYVGDGVLYGHMIARITLQGTPWAGVIAQDDHDAYVLGEVFRVSERALFMLDLRERYREGKPPELSAYLRERVNVYVDNPPRSVAAWVYTVDHNPLTDRSRLTHSWPQPGDPYDGRIRRHEPL